MTKPPRNKISRLPLDQRQVVITGLLDGRTYEVLRQDLAAAGVKGRFNNSSFSAFRVSAEFKAAEASMRNWKRRAEEKREFWSAILAGGGAEGLANVATFEAIEQLRDALGAADSANEKLRIAQVIGNLTRTVQAEAEARQSAKIAELKADLDRLRNPRKTEDMSGLTEAEKNKRIKERLGLN